MSYDKLLKDINTFRDGCNSIGIKDETVKNLIRFMNGSPYKSLVVALFNKGQEVGLYFFGIVYDAFVKFLIKYKYPVTTISTVIDNKKDISQLQFEIGFHFKIDDTTHTPTRSAFYGIF